MRCPKCQFENLEGAKFCNECGHHLTPTLKPIPHRVPSDEGFQRIQRYLPEGLAERILAQKDKIKGERRLVTVMFCDMEGFTPIAEKLGPENTYSLMDHIYELLIHRVSDYEGTVNELTGDGIMALFGAPIALEDAPQRALWSALSIHAAIAKFSGQYRRDMPIKMRIGVNTGPVVVGTLGSDLRVHFTAVGNTVNLASRMEGMAEPGFTYVSDATYQLTKGLFRFENMGKRAVKGRKEPITIYKVISGREGMYRPRIGSDRRIYSEMVGRGEELDLLKQLVLQAINGKGSVVNIIGEAGIGKSRLVAELKRQEALEKATILEGRALSIGKSLSFHPIIDLLKQWSDIRKDDGEATALGKLERAVKIIFPQEVYEIFPFLATLMGMNLPGKYAERVEGLEGEALDNLILRSFREFLIKASDIAPLIIILEDMHWADTSSIELIKSLFRLAKNHRILFINAFRPSFVETGARLLENLEDSFQEQYFELRLEPLNSHMSETLITNILNIAKLRHAFVNRIVVRSGGNPFFIEEVVRSLIDDGAIVSEHGTFELTERVRTIAIPNSINDVLMARIDRLEEDTRNLVIIASVIGRNFFFRLLQEVAGPIEDIENKLSHLKQIQLIRERRRMGELEYLFKHALAQEVAYQSILPPRRRELHLKVARSIEKLFSENLREFYGTLAYHYSKAESLKETETYLIKAGEEALKSSASSEALHYFQETLVLYLQEYDKVADPEKVAMIEKNMAVAFYNRGQYVEAIEYFDKALSYYWKKVPKHQISTLCQFLSGFFHFLVSLYMPILKFRRIPTQGDLEAVDLFFKKLKALPIVDPKRFFLESFPYFKGISSFDLNKFDLGYGLFVSASTLFSFTGISFGLSRKILKSIKDKIDRNNVRSFTIYDFSETLHNYFEGNWKQIKAYDEELVRKNLNIGELYWASHHHFWHGCPKLFQGDFEVPKLMVGKLNDLFDEYENDLSMLLKYLLNTSLLIECRKLHEALSETEKGIEFGGKISLGSILIEMHSRKAYIHVLMGDIDNAKTSLDLADKVRRETDTVPWQLTDFFRGKCELDLYQLKKSMKKGNKNNISKYRKKAQKSSKKLLKVTNKVAQYRTDSCRLRGIFYWLINRQKIALNCWQKAIDVGEHLGARIELSRTYFEIGKRLLEPGSKCKKLRGITPEEYLEKAKAFFEKKDLQWDLEKLNRVSRR